MSRLGALQTTIVSILVAWPVVAGGILVVLSTARAAERRRRLAAAERELQGMFRSLAGQPAPLRLALVVDALEEQAGPPNKPATTPTPRRRRAVQAS